jgi:hypothetical protein
VTSGLTQSPGHPKAFAQALHFARLPGRELAAQCLFFAVSSGSGGGLENPMPDVTVFGFPRSTFVQIARVLTLK